MMQAQAGRGRGAAPPTAKALAPIDLTGYWTAVITEDWHVRFKAEAVIYGHLHIRATHYRDGVRFEEVSLGYPQNYDPRRGIEPYLRQILPHPAHSEGKINASPNRSGPLSNPPPHGPG